jgi:hypothetical protein
MSTVVFLYRSIQSPAVVLSETQPSRHALLGCPTHYFIPKNALFYFPRGPGSPAPLDFTSVRDVVASVLSWKLLFGCFFINLVSVDVRRSLGRGRPGATSVGVSHELFFVWLYLDGFLSLCGVEVTAAYWAFRFICLTCRYFFSKRIFSIRRAISVTFCVMLFIA